MPQLKRLAKVFPTAEPHMVGDGFPVQSLFSIQNAGQELSPFLLFDYAAPTHFPPSAEPRGVGSHPHKGFETVTVVYQGGLEHRDSAGGRGVIGPGDVQWMTAAAGILHEEKHEREWSRRGGVLQMVQLWVNLPARFKSAPPGYQTLLKAAIPIVDLPGGGGSVRVIAGAYSGTAGAARTFTPMNVYDVRLGAGREASFDLPAGWTAAVAVLEGEVRFNGSQAAEGVALAVFEREGERVRIEAVRDAVLLILSGEPLDEPVAAYGPFVMNTQDEIRQGVRDYQAGGMGRLEPARG